MTCGTRIGGSKEIEILTIQIQAIPAENGHLVMLRVRGKKVSDFIDLLRRLHYDVLAAQAVM
jgi:hypothetical protein